MDILVIGAGVVGMSTAWALQRDGHRITVIDAAPEPAQGASHANGAQLSYSYVAPLAGPAIWRDLPKLVFGSNAPVRFRPGVDPFQYRWGLQFLAACTAAKSRATTAALLKLAFLSRDTLHQASELRALDFGWRQSGKLVVYSDAGSFAAAREQATFQNALGCRQQALDAAQCLAREPALQPIRDRLTGGIYTPDDAVADPLALCRGLHRLLADQGVTFLFNTPVRRLARLGRRIVGAETDAGLISAEAYVLAGGIGSRSLGQSAGLDLPIYPIKGYSLTAAIMDDAAAPRISVTDVAQKVVYARLGNQLRVAGMADIVGADAGIDPARIAQLTRQARHAFPAAADWRDLRPWAGLRPATPDGRPILGPSGLDNLVLNVGHGGLGLTLAFGSAAMIARHIGRRADPPALKDFALAA